MITVDYSVGLKIVLDSMINEKSLEPQGLLFDKLLGISRTFLAGMRSP
jgi:hypothetical protein